MYELVRALRTLHVESQLHLKLSPQTVTLTIQTPHIALEKDLDLQTIDSSPYDTLLYEATRMMVEAAHEVPTNFVTVGTRRWRPGVGNKPEGQDL